MDLSPAVNSLTSSPSTGEDRGKGALIFCPLTLALSRQGRENPSPGIVRRAKYFVGLKLALLLWLPVLAASEASTLLQANFAFFAVATSPTAADGVSAAASDQRQSAAVRDFECSLGKSAAVVGALRLRRCSCGRHGGRHGNPHAWANLAHGERHGSRCGADEYHVGAVSDAEPPRSGIASVTRLAAGVAGWHWTS